MQNYTLLYILGSGHCGSTLLDLLLNGHSQILGLGEITVLKRYIAIANGARYDVYRSSGSPSEKGRLRDWIETESHSLNDPFWQLVKQHYEDASRATLDQIAVHPPKWKTLRSWPAKDIDSWARPNETLLSCLQEVSGAGILTDASKSPHRLYLLQRSGLFNIKVVHLVRDGRAIINSYLRKYGDFGLALRRWVAPTVLAFYVRRQFAKANWLQVRYEELVTRPEETLNSICVFLGISFERAMLAYRGKPYFGVGGNRMVEGEEERIFLDERWKQTLSYKHRLAFALTGGWLNRLYGY